MYSLKYFGYWGQSTNKTNRLIIVHVKFYTAVSWEKIKPLNLPLNMYLIYFCGFKLKNIGHKSKKGGWGKSLDTKCI